MPDFRVPLGAARVTAGAVEAAFLEPGMDARAHNLRQFNPSPATDSLLERLRALALRLPPSNEREGLLAIADELIASNAAEGEAERLINGSADALVTDLRRIERSGGGEFLSAKAVYRQLQPALSCLIYSHVASAREISESVRILREAVDQVPRLMLLSKTVERELGAKKFAVLRQFVNAKGAGRSGGTAGAVEERSERSRDEH